MEAPAANHRPVHGGHPDREAPQCIDAGPVRTPAAGIHAGRQSEADALAERIRAELATGAVTVQIDVIDPEDADYVPADRLVTVPTDLRHDDLADVIATVPSGHGFDLFGPATAIDRAFGVPRDLLGTDDRARRGTATRPDRAPAPKVLRHTRPLPCRIGSDFVGVIHPAYIAPHSRLRWDWQQGEWYVQLDG